MKRHLTILAFILFGCLEPFDPEIPDSGNEFLVIDGIITDQPGPYIVQISKSANLNDLSEFVTGISEIFIETSEGLRDDLVESDSGVYQTTTIQGVVGESYRLNLRYEDQTYQSDWETILPSPEIERVFYQEEVRETTDRNVSLRGLQFFVDSRGTQEDGQYYRFEWEETWRFNAPSTILFRYLGNDLIDQIEGPMTDMCWKQETSIGINLATTENLTENVLSAHPLSFMTGEDRWTIRYSLLVQQFVFDEEEFTFWKNLRETNESLGSLFDSQPATLLGNITNLDDPQEKVLGYFSASGLREERIYIDDTDVSEILRIPSDCFDSEILLKEELGSSYERILLDKLNNGKLFFDFIYPPNSNVPLGAVIVGPECGDCRLTGGVLEQPDFWID